MLKKDGWKYENYLKLKELLDSSQSGDYIVTDWDNSAAIFDVEESAFLYQLENFLYKLTPEEFREVLKKDMEEDNIDLNLYDRIVDELCDDYEKIYGDELLINSTLHREFINKMMYYYMEFSKNLSYKTQCHRITYLFKNFTEEQLFNLGTETVLEMTKRELRKVKYKAKFKFGEVETIKSVGLKEIPQISNLFNSFRKKGVNIYICSASLAIVVSSFATNDKFNYGFKKEDIYGLELLKDENGKFIAEIDNTHLTYMEGKAKVIEMLESKHNRKPLLYIGDSKGDYNALTYDGLKVGLIINRNTSGKINDLKEGRIKNSTTYLLQDRDESIGEFVSST